MKEFIFTMPAPDSEFYISIIIQTLEADSIIDLIATKLELGSKQTLAHKDTSGNWIINDLLNYDLQYALCSQYSASTGEWIGNQNSNLNLLDNWYFADPVNQRGLTHYVGEGHIYNMYSVDRVQIYNGVSCDLVSGGLKFTFPGYSDAGNYIFGQPLENVPGIRGKVVTLSALVTGYTGGAQSVNLFGNFHSDYHDGHVSQSWQGPGLHSTTFLVPDDAEMILVGILSPLIPVALTVQAMKLELGPRQTLAHKEGETWVLNDPPPEKALELLKCQRYYEEVYFQHTFGTEYSELTIPYKVTKRAAPTVSVYSMFGTEGKISYWNALQWVDIDANMLPPDIAKEASLYMARVSAQNVPVGRGVVGRIVADANL